ncbi:TetR family transcriptional regulator [Subtercola boreus]|uniref:TetR/AcrR family transcriptional regulator n=1 Tax=Subtercola boreus TaxID=120213 RepID=UPI001C0F2F72|nr:TetR family transcriptional regulator [Subtercola boreus]
MPTRERIRSAASTLFRERGYARSSVRDIAALAEADAALVIRHFGSKELLFLETMQPSLDDEPLLAVPLEQLGRRFVEVVLADADEFSDVYLALVRGSGEPSIAGRLRTVHEETFVRPLLARLPGQGGELRARLAAALIGGLLYSLWVVGDEYLLAADRHEVVERYGSLLQDILTPAA